MNDFQRSLLNVLSGNFMDFKKLCNGITVINNNGIEIEYKYQSKYMLRVFISSTFTDTHLERNTLLDEILPILKQKVSGKGIEIVFVDMRYGVRDENTLEHETWIACKRELINCLDQSSGTFFLSLQSDKYGYQPIPKYIPQYVYEKRYQILSQKEKNLLDEWYQLDSNNVPLGRYVLKTLKDLNGPLFANILPKIRDILKDISFDIDYDDVIIDRSVSEYEIMSALSKVSDLHRVYWIRRIFSGTSPNDRNFNDTFDNNLDHIKLKNLLSKMESSISPSNISNLIVPFTSYIAKDDECKQYLKKWKEIVLNLFTEQLDNILKRKVEWESDSFGIEVMGKDIDEILHHCKLASEKCEDFSGRGDLIRQAIDIITSGNSYNKFKVCLSIIGLSGIGKTALMSKLASLMRNEDNKVIVRFCGTSGGSTHGLDLIKSICKQIELIYDLSKNNQIVLYGEAVEYFHTLLSKYPVILFIDSLDQLSNNNMARSKISFLDGIKELHCNSRIIVSTLPDEENYMYLCDTTLLTENVTRLVVKSFDKADNNIDESKSIIYSLLLSKSRTLSNDQLNYVMSKVTHEPTALYIRLAVKVVEKWYSFSNQNNLVLTESVRGLINQLFSSLEYEYGQVLVSSVLGFITFSVGGLNINHIQDLLSMDDDVINSTFQYSKPSILQIPIHVILRLYQSLCGLVVEREQGKIYWYHRQLKETAEHRYQVKELKCRNLMALYFSSTLREDIRKKRLVSEQPVFYNGIKPWFKSTNINVTLCIESIPQMLKSESYEMIFEAYKRLCNLDYICASIKVGEGFHLVNQFLELESVMEQSALNYSLTNKFRIAEIDYSEALIQVKHYLRWLRKDMNTIVKDPSIMLTVTATAQSQLSAARKNILSYIVSSSKTHGISFQEVSDDSSRDYWYRSRLLGGSQVFDSCLMVFPGHSVSVEAILRLRTVSFSKDCRMIVSGSDDHGVRVWDVKTGMEIQNFLGHSDWIKDVSFSPCMRKILSCSSDKTIRIWNVVTGVEMSKIKESASVNSAKFCPIGSKIVSGLEDTSIRIWDAISCLQLLQLDGHSGAVLSVSFSPDGSKIVSGSRDKSVRVWHAVSGTQLHQLDGHSDFVSSVSFSPDGSKIVSASYDTSIRIWDAISGTSMHQLDGHKGEVFSACFSPCGRKILSGGWDQSLRIWDAEFGIVKQLLLGHVHLISSVSFSLCGKYACSGSFDNTIRLWDATSTNENKGLAEGHTNQVFSVCFSNCGSKVLSASWDKSIRLWDVESGLEIQKFENGHSNYINSICFSPDGNHFVSGSDDKSIILWDLNNSLKVIQWNLHQHYVNSVNYSNCGKKFVSGSHDKSIIVWDVENNVEIMKITGHQSWVLCVKFDLTDEHIISGSDDKSLKIWSVSAGLLIHTLEGHTRVVISLTLSPDNKTIASCSEDTTIRLWDFSSGKQIKILNGHDDHVRSVSFTEDGSKIVSCSGDETVRIWNLTSGQEIKKLVGHSDWVNSVSFCPKSEKIVSCSSDYTVRIWDVVCEKI